MRPKEDVMGDAGDTYWGLLTGQSAATLKKKGC
jgi:hypothetical protein